MFAIIQHNVCPVAIAVAVGLFSARAIGDDAQGLLSVHKQPVATTGMQVELRQSDDAAEFVLLGAKSLDALQKLDHDALIQRFAVRVYSPDESVPKPPLLGTFKVDQSEFKFISRFPLSPNVQYQVDLGPLLDADFKPIKLLFTPRPKVGIVPATVVGIYPSSNVLPENTLKFYIHFSAPMSRGEAYERIHLIEGDKEVEAPFLELGEELWDADQMRFTLFIHPGRIKRGVKPREDIGLPMTDGKEYSLVIDRDWKSADRLPLTSRFVKTFRTTASDEIQPDPTQWKIGTPKAGTMQPITLTFNEPLDHAMLSRVLTVQGVVGNRIPGTVEVNKNETVWQFTPNKAWEKQAYYVAVASNLEDLAGNSIARPFESKLGAETDSPKSVEMIAIEFAPE
ncbi:MAG: Ig-like domain-containing protein [Pirellula sp.]